MPHLHLTSLACLRAARGVAQDHVAGEAEGARCCHERADAQTRRHVQRLLCRLSDVPQRPPVVARARGGVSAQVPAPAWCSRAAQHGTALNWCLRCLQESLLCLRCLQESLLRACMPLCCPVPMKARVSCERERRQRGEHAHWWQAGREAPGRACSGAAAAREGRSAPPEHVCGRQARSQQAARPEIPIDHVGLRYFCVAGRTGRAEDSCLIAARGEKARAEKGAVASPSSALREGGCR